MRKTLLSTAVGVVCAFVSAAVHAALAVNVLEAFVETSILYDASVSDDPSQIDQDSLDNHLDTIAYSSISGQAGGVFEARAAAFQSTLGFNAVYAEVATYFPEIPAHFNATAHTSYGIGVLSDADISGSTVPFRFVIHGGELRIDRFSSFDSDGGSNLVEVEAQISIEGQPWRFGARLTKDAQTGQPLVLEGTYGNSDPFALNVFPTLSVTMDGDSAVVEIPSIEGEVFIPGELFTQPALGVVIGYTMDATVHMRSGERGFLSPGRAGISDPFVLGTPTDSTDDLGGSFSPLGVQFFLDGAPITGATVVPLPPALVGPILGIVARRRRRA